MEMKLGWVPQGWIYPTKRKILRRSGEGKPESTAGKESDKMQTEEIRKIGNEMQKDPASNENYSKRKGKYKRAGRGTAKEEEGTTTVWDFWKMKTEELNVEDAPVHKDEEDSQAGRKPSNQVEGILTVIPTIRQLPDAEK